METKKAIICTTDYNSFGLIISKLQALNVEILKKNYDEEWKRYDIIVEMNPDIIKIMLDLVESIDAVILEAES